MGEYEAVLAYFGVTFVIFLGGLLWSKYRKFIKRRLNIADYQHTQTHDHHPA